MQQRRSKPTRSKSVKKTTIPPAGSGLIRLNKFVAKAGVCSRREADKLILQGRITVNGNQVQELGTKVNLDDLVKYNGKTLLPEKPVYILLNKPKDFITTLDDPEGRRTVMELIKRKAEERIYPVGRLDRKTTGILLLTNDGDLARKLSHPSSEVKKLYEVVLDKPISEEDFAKLNEGSDLEDGFAQPDSMASVSADQKTIGIQLHSGKNRIVRRMFEAIGYDVLRLDRVMYAGLTKKDLPRGKWRYLAEKEVVRLKYLKIS